MNMPCVKKEEKKTGTNTNKIKENVLYCPFVYRSASGDP
jgi:hypothetical protein